LTCIDDVVRRIKIPGTQSRIRIELFSFENAQQIMKAKESKKNKIEQQSE
jgi:hypothetical protein